MRTALVTGATDGIGFETALWEASERTLADWLSPPGPWVFHARRRVEAGELPEKLAQ